LFANSPSRGASRKARLYRDKAVAPPGSREALQCDGLGVGVLLQSGEDGNELIPPGEAVVAITPADALVRLDELFQHGNGFFMQAPTPQYEVKVLSSGADHAVRAGRHREAMSLAQA
jgi:hypothetical protein